MSWIEEQIANRKQRDDKTDLILRAADEMFRELVAAVKHDINDAKSYGYQFSNIGMFE